MYYMFNDNLEVGDVILTNNIEKKTKWKSSIQKWHTTGNFSHVALYICDGRFIEAVGTGVRFFSITGVAFSELENFKVLRYENKVEFPNLTTHGVSKYTFMNYNTSGIMNFVKNSNPVKYFKTTKVYNNYQVFCSQLVTRIYEDYGVSLFNKSHHEITPADFEYSNCFIDVTAISYIEKENLPSVVYLIYDLNKQVKESILTEQEQSVHNSNLEISSKYGEYIPSQMYAFNILQQVDSIKEHKYFDYMFNMEELSQFKDLLTTLNLESNSIDFLCLYFDLIKAYDIDSYTKLDEFLTDLDNYLFDVLNRNGFYSLYNIMIKEEYVFLNPPSLNISEKNDYISFAKDKMKMHIRLIDRHNIEYETLRYSKYKSLKEYANSLSISISFSKSLVTQLSSHVKMLSDI